MSGCTTWHIRIDLVDDGTQVRARAKLIGAPAAMTRGSSAPAHDGCLIDSGDGKGLAGWNSLPDLSGDLVAALAREHRAHSVQPGDAGAPARRGSKA